MDEGRSYYSGGTALLSNKSNLHGLFEKFMRAARIGDTSTLTDIYKDNKRILSSRAAFGSTCVHIAAENGQIPTLEWLRDRGGDFGAKTRPRNQTPLHFAAARGQVPALLWLCENAQALGCNLDAKDYRKRTASELATQYNFHDAARVLDDARRVPHQKKLQMTKYGKIWGGGVPTTWESYTRDQLIEGLSDLRELHAAELDARKMTEEKQFYEISSLKSELADVKLQVSELKSMVEHLAKSNQDAVNKAMVEINLEESARSRYLNSLTVGTVRVEADHLAATTGEWESKESKEASVPETEGKEGKEEEVEEEEEEED